VRLCLRLRRRLEAGFQQLVSQGFTHGGTDAETTFMLNLMLGFALLSPTYDSA